MKIQESLKVPHVSFVIGIVCFTLHFTLIFHHTYFDASQKDTLSFPSSPKEIQQPQRWHNYLDLNRWDAAYYEKIVLQGYQNPDDPSKPSFSILWYPGYPLIAKLVHLKTEWKVSFIFSILSAVFTLGFWLFLWNPRMLSIFEAKALLVTSLLIICWPGGFYWFAGMTEPLIGLLVMILLYLWFSQRFNGIIAVLAFATSVKQLFIPVTFAMVSLEILKSHPKSISFYLKSLVALSGFIGFGLYSWIYFDNFFMSSDLVLSIYEKKINLFSLVDFNHYARYIRSPGGFIAAGSMCFLLVVAFKLTKNFKSWQELSNFFIQPQKELSVEFVLWWLALACTIFFVLGDSYTQYPFAAFMRYQTTNIPIFLLFAFQVRKMSWWKIGLWLIPLASIGLFYQNKFTINYWFWEWVS